MGQEGVLGFLIVARRLSRLEFSGLTGWQFVVGGVLLDGYIDK
jgi:hypothetical protein